MDSHDSPKETAAALQRAVRVRPWFGRLRRRMELRGFPPTDALYVSVSKCYDATQELHVRAIRTYSRIAESLGQTERRARAG